jgi:hypothetical protein
VFEELETSRASSWQYELQQLKFANQRLAEEADRLESSLSPYDQRTVFPQLAPVALADENARSPGHILRDWVSPLHPLKRAWDSVHVT